MNRDNNGRFVKGYKWTDELKMKVSNTLKGIKRPPFSAEHIRKLSESHKGQKCWCKGTKGLIKHSDEWKEKMSERLTGLAGDKNYNWAGDDVGYSGVHDWVRKWKGEPLVCEKCGRTVKNTRYIDWANKDHKYRRVLDDYIRLCKKCHYAYDKLNNKKNGKFSEGR
jgi:hypothetical protein